MDPTRKIATILIIKGKKSEKNVVLLTFAHRVALCWKDSNNDSAGMEKFCKYGIHGIKTCLAADSLVTFLIITEINYPSYGIFNKSYC